MGRVLRLVAASLIGMVLGVVGTGPAFALEPAAASITNLQITDATLDVRTGVARVDAVVTCSETMELNAYSVIYQGRGRSDHFAGSAGGTELNCSPTPTTFSIEVTPLYDGGKLIPGEAHVNVFVESSTNPLGVYLGTSQDMHLTVEHP